MVALTEGESWGWTSPALLGLVALARRAFLVVWGLVESRSSSPMVDLRMLAHRPVLLTNIATLISGFALFSCFVLVPAFVETDSEHGYGFGASATKAGLYLLPSSIAMLFAGPLAGLIGRRFGSKWPLAGGMLVVSCRGAAVRRRPRRAVARARRQRAARGSASAPRSRRWPALIADNVDAHEMGVATGMNTVVRMIGAVDRRPGRGRAADRADDRRDVGPRRVCVHDGLRAQRGRGARRRR